MRMIGIQELLLLQLLMVNSVSELATGNFLSPVLKLMWTLVMARGGF